jgi:hypothetical protein
MKTHFRPTFHLFPLIALLASLLGSAVLVTPVHAAGIVVNADSDKDGLLIFDGLCSLREALANANNDAATYPDCAAGSGADTITFAANYTITLRDQLLITSAITIIGNGAANTILQANSAPHTATYRVIQSTGNLTLTGLTVRHGRCTGSCPTIGNVGGGIFNEGVLTVSNATFSGNTANYGGGMYSYLSSPTLTNVTFSANSAFLGGGMVNSDNSPTLTNVTFNGNAAQKGGGMYNFHNSSPTLTNVTFSGNSASSSGGGMFNDNSSPTLKNVIIANSTSGGDCVNNSSALNASSSNNLIKDAANACGLTDGVNGNIIGSDPALGALADNGGSTQTFALLAVSPAIDAGTNNGCPATDQRGVTRPQGAKCDIGAYEKEHVSNTFKSNAAQDGWILESSETSGKGKKINSGNPTLNIGDDKANRQYRAILSFDTSSLPEGVVISSVTLTFKHAGKKGTLPFNTHGNLLADVLMGPFSGDPALQKGDFKSPASKSGALAYTKNTVENWYVQSLSAADFQYINLDGPTQFRLRFKKDDNNDFGADFLKIFSGDAAEADRPQLIVEYYVP